MRQWRQAFGVSTAGAPGAAEGLAASARSAARVPLEARLALWISALGLLALGGAQLWRG